MANEIPKRLYGSYVEVVMTKHTYPIVEEHMAQEFATIVRAEMDKKHPNWSEMSQYEFVDALEIVAKDVFIEHSYFSNTDMEVEQIDIDHNFFEFEEDSE